MLKLDKVGAGDNFFDLGGNSLLLQAVHARMEARVGRKVPLVELFQFPTVRALAAHLSKGSGPAEQPPAPAASAEDRAEGRRRLSRQRRLRPGSD
ncbi:phosphopantetheine-binding protein [Pyxidicoccus sp. MSG2]|uniref:phosphopantetheine-binding protein n=1 Tax=Pyxidicoccus sp. MSG2 TaxID=2996790 RepID=UPI002270C91E|nr:phosphopantetheine-binding protein [Pyxidicoccus sp. MSG2]MCY1016470.1 phosphopantetheine-binding protein [Pyxidicoccus sp. MSG2]